MISQKFRIYKSMYYIVRWEFGVPTCSRVPITVEKLQKMSTGIPSINSIRQWALCILFISCSFRQLSIMSSPLTENDGDKHLRENPEFPHGTVSLDDVLLDFLASIIVFCCFSIN